MRLKFFPEPNFGDALNPVIFNRFLPDFFDADDSIDFFGIGSIIGFRMMLTAKRKVVFSSGFAYGDLPKLDATYDIVCVRGPKTARALNLDEKLAITDGAALLREFKYASRPKHYKYSFMPHWKSEKKYDWKALCDEADIHFISPMNSTDKVIEELLETEVLLAEAMHGAIVADTLRVPWIPVKAFEAVNEFKWEDWASSLGMPYVPNDIRSVCLTREYIDSALDIRLSAVPGALRALTASCYEQYQRTFTRESAVKQLKDLKQQRQYLSTDLIFNSKVDQLLDKIQEVKAKYQNHAPT